MVRTYELGTVVLSRTRKELGWGVGNRECHRVGHAHKQSQLTLHSFPWPPVSARPHLWGSNRGTRQRQTEALGLGSLLAVVGEDAEHESEAPPPAVSSEWDLDEVEVLAGRAEGRGCKEPGVDGEADVGEPAGCVEQAEVEEPTGCGERAEVEEEMAGCREGVGGVWERWKGSPLCH